MPDYNAVGILLAAGESSRMGRPKGLLPWRGTTLVEYQMNSLLQGGCDRVIVVTGKYDEEMAPLLKDRPSITRVYNPKYLEGKTTSIKAGVWELPDGIHSVVLLAVDQPRPAWVIEKVLRKHTDFGADITSPGYDGHGGHPLIFDAGLRTDLAAITEEGEGVRAIFKKPDIDHHRIEFDSAVVRLDINTPEAYEDALASYTELAKSKL
ncbi:nucleotidyltransferase family protein [Candidatus Lucifugimonas marina]|uniref:NTP transferase domain-containing protein n=1 Tax=Candidatus Lucifugimonas marina TaxID=3038979 RepID=A0AAJ6CSB4_9CHLR|nr:NTP transferase domain-containing protein [SAR202 cluster bacterium JH702]MDG0868509.1 NTP transferase domain-containing protein [SAR202 cluster bacterium JH639]WFG35142.1 NTP transferase domain-containing protein [SAR202 cluster bacterium JH545]WFG39098.1 NTP transferase domain-containing protein [SAR202 cluster bacterium JH1073]